MIDIHSHILPGLDDGAPDLKTAFKMAKRAVKDGIAEVIATPHCLDGVHNCRKEDILLACQQFNKELYSQGIPLKVYPGAEIRLTPELIDCFRRGELLTLGDSGKAVLLELPQRCIGEAPVKVVKQLKDMGIQTIIAHPERNFTIQNHPDILDELIFSGALLQITADSLIGKFGRSTTLFAENLVVSDRIHFIATDCHSLRGRSPRIHKAYKKLLSMVGMARTQEIVLENRDLILNSIEISWQVNPSEKEQQVQWIKVPEATIEKTNEEYKW